MKKYDLACFSTKGEVLFDYHTDHEQIKFIYHAGRNNNKESYSLDVPFNFLLFYKNKFNSDVGGVWMLDNKFEQGESIIAPPKYYYNVPSCEKSKATLDIEEKYDYFIIRSQTRNFSRTIKLEMLEKYNTVLTIDDTFKRKAGSVQFVVNNLYKNHITSSVGFNQGIATMGAIVLETPVNNNIKTIIKIKPIASL